MKCLGFACGFLCVLNLRCLEFFTLLEKGVDLLSKFPGIAQRVHHLKPANLETVAVGDDIHLQEQYNSFNFIFF